jgi:Spy/CpxP family protein refolding chaperone
MTLLLSVFAAGIALGGPTWDALSNDGQDGRDRRESTDQRDRERGGEDGHSYSDHLQEALSLTAEQRAAVDSVLEEGQSDMREVWRAMRAQIDTLRQAVSVDIMQLLDEEQQTKYQELIARSNRRGDRERAPKENRNHE